MPAAIEHRRKRQRLYRLEKQRSNGGARTRHVHGHRVRDPCKAAATFHAAPHGVALCRVQPRAIDDQFESNGNLTPLQLDALLRDEASLWIVLRTEFNDRAAIGGQSDPSSAHEFTGD
jgi:hypothetical protein